MKRALAAAAVFLTFPGLPGCLRDSFSGAGHPGSEIVILITLDTLNPSYLGCYGDNRTRSPMLDRLARRGTLFSECHTVINLTTPSHASMLTGLFPHQLGIHINAHAVSDRPETIAEVLSESGFATMAAVSSFQLNPEFSNLGQGFGTFYTCDEPEMDGAGVARSASEWLTAHDGEKQFAWIHLFDCHAPYIPKEPYNRFYPETSRVIEDGRIKEQLLFQDGAAGKPPLMQSKPFLRRQPFSEWYSGWLGDTSDDEYAVRLYRGTISEIDHYLETILLPVLDRNGFRKTALIVTSDHGESLGQHGIYYDHWGPYEPSIDVPLIACGGKLARNTLRTALTGTIDIPPTLLDLAGCRIPETYAGRSLLPVINGRIATVRKHLVIEHARQAAVTVRDPETKYILPLREEDFYPGEPELYRIDTDINETTNALIQNPEKAAFLRAVLDSFGETSLMTVTEPSINNRDQEVLDKLKTLGYIN